MSMVEVHAYPDWALSDGNQSLKPERFSRLIRDIAAIAQAVGREMGSNT